MKFEPGGIHIFGILTILSRMVVIRSQIRPAYSPRPTPKDINYYFALRAQLIAFKYRTEEPSYAKQVQYVDTNVEGWSFAYNGSEAADDRPDNDKAITWAVGLLGIDFFGNTYPVTAMGTLITPQIVMTLCASINSFYRSYKGILDEERAKEDHFYVSNTSDVQFDVRAPTMVAYWASREGFLTKTGDERVMEVSRYILATQKCSDAVEGGHINQTILQYITPAFLLLRDRISNPFGGGKPPHMTTFLRKTREDDSKHEYFKRTSDYNLEMIAYKQRVCNYPPNITELSSLKVWRIKKPGSTQTEVVEAGLHLLSTQWSETSTEKQLYRDTEPKDRKYMKTCEFSAFDQWRQADHDANIETPLRYAIKFKIAMAETFRKAKVGCMEWHHGNLCGAPSGSPVFYYRKGEGKEPGADHLVGMSITRPKTKNFEKADEKLSVIVLMVGTRAGKRALVKDIQGLINTVYNLAKTREIAANYPLYELEEPDKITLDLFGNLDADLAPKMVEKFKKKGIIKSRAARTISEPFVTHFVSPILVILLCSSP